MIRRIIQSLVSSFSKFSIYEEMSFYAVARGRKVGIYPSWYINLSRNKKFSVKEKTFFRAECQSQIQGYPGAQFKKFSSQQEAEGFIQQRNSDTPEILPVKPRTSNLQKASDDLKKCESSFSGSGNQSPTAEASTSGSQSKYYYAVAIGKNVGIYSTW
jgi:viroplasmin and RNaseH domain-containing protein